MTRDETSPCQSRATVWHAAFQTAHSLVEATIILCARAIHSCLVVNACALCHCYAASGLVSMCILLLGMCILLLGVCTITRYRECQSVEVPSGWCRTTRGVSCTCRGQEQREVALLGDSAFATQRSANSNPHHAIELQLQATVCHFRMRN